MPHLHAASAAIKIRILKRTKQATDRRPNFRTAFFIALEIKPFVARSISMTPPAETTDEILARRTQNGDTEAFAALIDRYQPKLARYGKKFLRDREDVRDLLQDIFIKAYMNLKSFDAGRAFSPWIYRIAHNEFISEIRKRAGKFVIPVFDFDILFPHLASPETADRGAREKELTTALAECLDELDPKYREPLVLYYYEELAYAEIAEILQIPTSTVGVRIARAKSALKKIAEQKNVSYA